MPGILSQADQTGDHNMVDLIKEYFRQKYDKPGNIYLGLVQRLDRPVGGIMVFAKTTKSFTRLQSQMKARTIDKMYLALSSYAPPLKEGELVHYLLKDQDTNHTTVYETEQPGSKLSKLFYKLIGSKEGKYLFQVKLITGRSHQIRAQMAYIGCPLVADVKYGRQLTKPAYDLCLYAYYLSFEHPTLKTVMHWTYLPKVRGYWTGMEEFFPVQNLNE